MRRDVYLTKEKSEFLASRLQERNLLEKRVEITLYRKRTEDLLALFTMKDNLCFCNDITELFEQLEILYDKTNWRLFMDTSKDSIKSVLLHNGNTLPSVPIAYSTTMKKSYENLKAILTSMQYDDLIFVQILRLWPCLLVFSLGILNFGHHLQTGPGPRPSKNRTLTLWTPEKPDPSCDK